MIFVDVGFIETEDAGVGILLVTWFAVVSGNSRRSQQASSELLSQSLSSPSH